MLKRVLFKAFIATMFSAPFIFVSISVREAGTILQDGAAVLEWPVSHHRLEDLLCVDCQGQNSTALEREPDSLSLAAAPSLSVDSTIIFLPCFAKLSVLFGIAFGLLVAFWVEC